MTVGRLAEEGSRIGDREALGGVASLFWRISAAMSVLRIGMFVIPFLAYYLDKGRHLGTTDIAIVIAAFGIGSALGPLIGGHLADAFGRRLMMVCGNLAAAGSYVWLGRAGTLHSMVAAAFAVGFAFDFWRPGAYAMLDEASGDEAESRRADSLFFWVMQITSIAGCMAAGFMAVTVGWIWLFYGNAAACIGFVLVAVILIPESRPGRIRRSGTVLRDGHLLLLILLWLVCLTAYEQSEYALPIRFAGAGIGPVEFAVILNANPVTAVIVQIPIQKRLDKTPGIAALAIGMLLVGVGIAVTGIGHEFTVGHYHVSALAWFCASSIIWVLGEIAILGPGMALVTGIAPPGRQASYSGAFLSAIGLSTITASVAGAWFIHLPGLHLGRIHLSGLDLLWAACALAGVISSGCCLMLAGSLRRRAEHMTGAGKQEAAA